MNWPSQYLLGETAAPAPPQSQREPAVPSPENLASPVGALPRRVWQGAASFALGRLSSSPDSDRGALLNAYHGLHPQHPSRQFCEGGTVTPFYTFGN